MNNNELQTILIESENSNIEFKENLTNIDKDIVAFASSSVGKFIEALRTSEMLTRSDYETITKASKRTAIRDLQFLLSRGVIVEISTSKTDPERRYKLA